MLCSLINSPLVPCLICPDAKNPSPLVSNAARNVSCAQIDEKERFLFALLLGMTASGLFLRFLPRNLHKGFRRHGTAPRAALLIKKSQHFAQRIGICRVPQKSSVPPNVDQSHLFQFFQVM